jgi:TRAP-type C4-dicarboxylate transport system permease small subunit
MAKKINTIMGTIYETLTCVIFIAVFLCAVIQVVSRYILRISIPWTEEMARYCLIMFTMLGSAIVTQKGGHLGAYFLRDRAHGRLKALMLILSSLTSLAFMGVVIIGAFVMLPLTWDVTATTIGWFRTAFLYGTVILAAVLMLLVLFKDLFISVQRLISGKTDDLVPEVSRIIIRRESEKRV